MKNWSTNCICSYTDHTTLFSLIFLGVCARACVPFWLKRHIPSSFIDFFFKLVVKRQHISTYWSAVCMCVCVCCVCDRERERERGRMSEWVGVCVCVCVCVCVWCMYISIHHINTYVFGMRVLCGSLCVFVRHVGLRACMCVSLRIRCVPTSWIAGDEMHLSLSDYDPRLPSDHSLIWEGSARPHPGQIVVHPPRW